MITVQQAEKLLQGDYSFESLSFSMMLMSPQETTKLIETGKVLHIAAAYQLVNQTLTYVTVE